MTLNVFMIYYCTFNHLILYIEYNLYTWQTWVYDSVSLVKCDVVVHSKYTVIVLNTSYSICSVQYPVSSVHMGFSIFRWWWWKNSNRDHFCQRTTLGKAPELGVRGATWSSVFSHLWWINCLEHAEHRGGQVVCAAELVWKSVQGHLNMAFPP